MLHVLAQECPETAECARFAPVALQWGAALLKDSDQVKQGVDLFGRDAMLLGRVLMTLVRLLCSAL